MTVTQAINALWEDGKQYREGRSSKGVSIGAALYGNLSAEDCIDAAIEMLEQWNGHLSAAAITAIEKGGNVTRTGRILRIELPQEWADIDKLGRWPNERERKRK